VTSPLARPLFIVFEGIDGAGKTTQAARLAARLEREGIPVRRFAEPTQGKYGQEIRRRAREGPPLAPREELDLFLKDRAEHVAQNVTPALERREAIVQDRSFLSTVAYQGAREGLGLEVEGLIALHDAMPKPDVVVLLDLPVAAGLARVQSRGKSDAFEDAAFLERVLENFRRLVGRVAGTHVRRVDAAREPDVVERAVWSEVEPLLARARKEPV
jgi:dTMP kinase